MIDSQQQRINMVESQVRPSDVTDRRIIRAMLEVPREAFVPASLQALAYMDEAVPVVEADGTRQARCLLAPRTFAMMVQLAEIGPDAVVLDAALATRANETLRGLGVGNATVIGGALEKGAASHAPFDAILLQGAVPRIPEELLEQLKDGGRLVAVIADGTFGRAQLWRRTGKLYDPRPAFDAGAQPLPGFARQAEFVL